MQGRWQDNCPNGSLGGAGKLRSKWLSAWRELREGRAVKENFPGCPIVRADRSEAAT
jgi:ribosome modulation factor